MHRLSPGLFVSFLMVIASVGQGKQYKQLSGSLDEMISQRLTHIAPGCVVLIAKKGEVIYKKAFGLANMELIAG